MNHDTEVQCDCCGLVLVGIGSPRDRSLESKATDTAVLRFKASLLVHHFIWFASSAPPV